MSLHTAEKMAACCPNVAKPHKWAEFDHFAALLTNTIAKINAKHDSRNHDLVAAVRVLLHRCPQQLEVSLKYFEQTPPSAITAVAAVAAPRKKAEQLSAKKDLETAALW